MSLFNNKNTISIDFNADEIKVVEGKYSKKGIVVGKSFSMAVPNGLYIDGEIQDMDQLVYLLKNIFTENKISQGEAYGVVNSSKIIMREITMPKVEASQIEAILSYQLEDYMPVNPEDYVVKYMPLGSVMEDGNEKLNLMLIGVPRTIVEGHLNLFKHLSLKPMVLDFAGNAINKLIFFNDDINNYYDNEDTVACIDLQSNHVVLTITQKGILKVSRVVKVDIVTLDNESEEPRRISGLKTNLNEILEGIEMVFRYYKTREIGNNIGLILLYGNMSDIDGIEQLFSNYFEKPCIRLNNLNKVKFNGDLAKYANAIGTLVRLDEVK